MKTAYFDCFSGISGDMTLGAFLDLGVPLEWLLEKLHGLPLDGFEMTVDAVSVDGIQANQVHISLSDQQTSRHYQDIKSLIESSPLPSVVVSKSLNIFEKIGLAEAKIHGKPLDKVHFHEVGALDSIIDIVGAALCLDYLGIENVISSKIPLGNGFVECSHGRLPVPAPATLEILKDIPVYGAGVEQEMVTPTGAAIITSFTDCFGAMPDMSIEAIGYGAGQRKFNDRPNVLRVLIGSSSDKTEISQVGTQKDRVHVVETCIDDMNPELFGFLMERLFEDGALDVYLIPIFMKKNRPGTMVHVLCDDQNKKQVIDRILSETTTTGVRTYLAGRYTLKRELTNLETVYGRVQVKRIFNTDGSDRLVPEYDVCRSIARDQNIPLQVVYDVVLNACHQV